LDIKDIIYDCKKQKKYAIIVSIIAFAVFVFSLCIQGFDINVLFFLWTILILFVCAYTLGVFMAYNDVKCFIEKKLGQEENKV